MVAAESAAEVKGGSKKEAEVADTAAAKKQGGWRSLKKEPNNVGF